MLTLKSLKQEYEEKLKPLNLTLDFYTQKIEKGQDLAPFEAYGAIQLLMSEIPSDSQKANFLTALTQKGEAIDEITSFALGLREMSEKVQLDFEPEIIADTCGTGGGTIETFNISTTVAFILSAGGVVVAKHGNRAATSKCGSADVLEALGVNINLSPNAVSKCIKEIGIGFLFAPNYHKAFKNVAKVRKELGIPTVFNFLGPLVNPAFDERKRNTIQLLGVRDEKFINPIAKVLCALNVKRAWVVCGYNKDKTKFMDELSICGENKITELTEDGKIIEKIISAEDFGFELTREDVLAGGDAKANSEIVLNILKGKERGPKRDITVFNAGAALLIAGKCNNLKDGIKMSEDLVDNGSAFEKLKKLKEFTSTLL